jgi:putative nucleotidyltransferase with HDIG domain
VSRIAHLVSRFFGSLRPRALDAETVAWVVRMLEQSELEVWNGLGPADRAESVAVARRLEVALAGTADESCSTWVGAALLHDVGKQASAYGPVGRSVVTIVKVVRGDEAVRDWAGRSGRVRSRMGRYATHDEVGAELLRRVGARPEMAAWAEAHHRVDRWESVGIPLSVCRALAAADGEDVPKEA